MKTKSENQKALPKFLLIVVLALLVGAALGFLIAAMDLDSAQALNAVLQHGLVSFAPYAIWLCALVTVIGGLTGYRQSKRRYLQCGEQDEDGLRVADRPASFAMVLTSVLMIIGYFFLAVLITYVEDVGKWAGLTGLLGTLSLIAAMIVSQQKQVDLLKRFNPEKRGSVYDMKFAKEWFNSCDEAEKTMIWQAGFAAYRATQTACMLLWVVIAVMSLLFRYGILPVAVVSILWLVNTIAYSVKCFRLEGSQ